MDPLTHPLPAKTPCILASMICSTLILFHLIFQSFLASRKGGNRRYRECDIDELKKFNAVQCIKSIVSTDQEVCNAIEYGNK